MKNKLILFFACSQLFLKAQVPTILKDISVGSGSITLRGIYTLPNNDILFSAGTNTASTSGVYVSDGSTAGTKILKSFSNGKNLNSNEFIPYNGKVYLNNGFTYSTVPMWRTDGTSAGTDSVPITGIFGSGLSGIGSMSVALNLIFFPSGNRLWRSDGTTAGSYSIASGITSVSFFETLNNVLYFTATNTVTGIELWRTDGTAAGTFMLKDIWPGSLSSNPVKCGVVNNLVFFTADNQINGSELWRTDGTVNGTFMIKDIYPGAISSNVFSTNFWSSSNGVFFNANNAASSTALWFSDGTGANTYSLITGYQTKPVIIGNEAYFLNANNHTIYKTNGSLTGTASINAVGSVPNPTLHFEITIQKSLMLYNNELYYLTHKKTTADSVCLRKVNLSLSSKSMILKVLGPQSISALSLGLCYPEMNKVLNNGQFIYFMNNVFCNLIHFVLDFNLNTNRARMYPITAGNKEFYTSANYLVNNKLYFPFQTNFYGPGYLDLTTDSLVPLVNSNSGIGFTCSNAPFNGFSDWHPYLFKLNNKYYFICHDPNYGVEFYETDYTKANTHLVKDVYPGVNPYFPPNSLCAFQNIWETPNNIYFLGNDGVNGFELWVFNNAPNNPNGINQQENFRSLITSFPNPTKDDLQINSDVELRYIQIYNLVGSIQFSQLVEGKNTSVHLDVQNLSKGIYVIEVETMKGKEMRKFIKE